MEIKFDSAINEYLDYIKIKRKNTTYITNKRRILKYILPYFKNKNIFDLSCKDYICWQNYIENLNLKYNYKSSLHYCFSNFINYCILFYNLNENIAKKVGNFKNNEIDEVGNIWTINEFNQFINKVDNDIYKTLFKTLYFTGMRKGEILALKFNDINFNNNTISINKTITRFNNLNNDKIITTPKTKSSIRIISIDDKLSNEIKELQNYYIEHFNGYNNNYFIFGGNKSIKFATLERKKNYYCVLANVKQIKIHEFRHSHACLLFQNNVPIEDISHRLGHSTISMTMNVYLKYLPHNEKRVINTLNKIRLN